MFENRPYIAPGIVALIVATDANHICFDANSNSGLGKDYAGAQYMEIRGIVYGVHAHLYKWSDGTWNLGLEKESDRPWLAKYHSLSLSRPKSTIKPSDPAREYAAAKVVAIVREWVAENAAVLEQAQQGERLRQLERRQSELAAKREELRKLEREIAEIEAELNPQPVNTFTGKGEGGEDWRDVRAARDFSRD